MKLKKGIIVGAIASAVTSIFQYLALEIPLTLINEKKSLC
jgi:hypothetical protein